jgi:hypothetical protein
MQVIEAQSFRSWCLTMTCISTTWEHWKTFSPADQDQLCKYVRDAPYINDDPDREELADKILADKILATER